MAVEIGNLTIRGSFGDDDQDVAYIDGDKLRAEFELLRMELLEEVQELIQIAQSKNRER